MIGSHNFDVIFHVQNSAGGQASHAPTSHARCSSEPASAWFWWGHFFGLPLLDSVLPKHVSFPPVTAESPAHAPRTLQLKRPPLPPHSALLFGSEFNLEPSLQRIDFVRRKSPDRKLCSARPSQHFSAQSCTFMPD